MTLARLAMALTPLRARGLLAAVAAGLLVSEVVAPESVPDMVALDAPRPPADSHGLTAATARGPYAAFDQHPLFFPARAPWVAPPPTLVALPKIALPQAAAKPARTTPQGYRMIGLVLTETTQTALLLAPNGKSLSVHRGSVLDGWVLREIGRTGLRFDADGESFDLPFPKKS